MQRTPDSLPELMQRAHQLAGLTLGHCATQLGVTVPNSLQREKGWVGQLLEGLLGAQSGSKAVPDFEALQVELKTIPISPTGKPLESTYVFTVPLMKLTQLSWEDSVVRNKLKTVLWIPIEGKSAIPLSYRRIGTPFLWQLPPEDEACLRQDWQELMELLVIGCLDRIHGGIGTYLHIRPKAANAQARCWAVGETGEKLLTLNRGFYLRTAFTQKLLQSYYA